METTTVQKLENLLLVSVPQDMTDEDVISLRRQVLQKIRQHGSRWVLLDFSQVDICDSFFGRFIYSMAEMVKLMGSKVVISGLQDAVIETLIDLGLTLPHIPAVLDLDDALALSRKMDKEQFGGFNQQIREEVEWAKSESDHTAQGLHKLPGGGS